MIRTCAYLVLLSASPFAQTIFVDDSATGAQTGASWSDAFSDLAAALAAATPGDEVWVAAGTYRPAPPGGSVDAAFVLPSGVRALGGFDGTEVTAADRSGLFEDTVLDGDLAGDDQPGFVGVGDNVRHVVRVPSGAAGVELDGFLVRGGNANGPGPTGRSGGGLFAAGDVTVRNVTFRENLAEQWGGAVHASGAVATLLEDCAFADNRAMDAGGAVYQVGGALTVARGAFTGNVADNDGGALYVGGTPEIVACTLAGNHAVDRGGAIFGKGATLDVHQCAFLANTTGTGAFGFGGAVYNDEGGGTIATSIFTANAAVLGGAIYSAGALDGSLELRIAGCTIYGNTGASTLGGAGVYSTQTGFQLASSILWENAGPAGTDFEAQYAGPARLADFSCIQSMSPAQAATLGAGNFSTLPLFLDPDGADDTLGTADDDLRIGGLSPCIDAGSSAGAAGIELDHAGLPRAVDDPETPDVGDGGPPAVDVGAHEYHSTWSLTDSISIAQGGSAELLTKVDASFAGELYLVLGSSSGTHPGLALYGHTMLLNPDPYFLRTLNAPNQPPLTASFGSLGPDGDAATTFTLPAGMDPILIGLEVNHACAVISTTLLLPIQTTTPFQVSLIP